MKRRNSPLPRASEFFFFSSRRRHTRSLCDWSSDVCSSDLLLTTLVALIVALAAMIGYDLRAYHRILVSDMTTQAELLGRTSAPALAFDDSRVAKENLSLLRFRPLVSSAAIYNARGALFATSARADDPRGFPKLPEPDGVRVEDRDLILFKRVVNDGEILGTVYLRADYELFDRVFD